MKKNLYAILDEKTSFMAPFIEETDDAAVRGFKFSVVNQPNIIGFAPSDFKLYRIGTYDTTSAEIVSLDRLVYLASGTDAFKKDVISDA